MVYATVELNITNPIAFDQYKVQAGKALEKHGGAPLTVSGQSEIIEGDKDSPQVAVILSFPEIEAAKAWINDPELQHIHKLRQDSGEVSILLLG